MLFKLYSLLRVLRQAQDERSCICLLRVLRQAQDERSSQVYALYSVSFDRLRTNGRRKYMLSTPCPSTGSGRTVVASICSLLRVLRRAQDERSSQVYALYLPCPSTGSGRTVIASICSLLAVSFDRLRTNGRRKYMPSTCRVLRQAQDERSSQVYALYLPSPTCQ